jgi:hypothetical protein
MDMLSNIEHGKAESMFLDFGCLPYNGFCWVYLLNEMLLMIYFVFFTIRNSKFKLKNFLLL